MMFRISPSSLNLWLNCPAKWYYQYVLDLFSEPSIPMLVGSLAHEVLENLPKKLKWKAIEKHLSSEQTLKDRLVELSSGIIDEMYDNADLVEFINEYDGNYTKTMQDVAWSIEGWIMYYVRSFFMHTRSGKTPYKAWDYLQPKKAELEIVVNTDLKIKRKYPPDVDGGQPEYAVPVKLKGIIDAVQLMTRNEVAVAKIDTGLIDYKTSKVYDLPIDSDHTLQMEFYSMLWEKKFGELPAWCMVMYMKPMIPAYFRPDKNVSEIVMEKVGLMVAAVQSRFYPGNPAYKWCDSRWCEWFERCNADGRYTGDVIVGDKDPDFER